MSDGVKLQYSSLEDAESLLSDPENGMQLNFLKCLASLPDFCRNFSKEPTESDIFISEVTKLKLSKLS